MNALVSLSLTLSLLFAPLCAHAVEHELEAPEAAKIRALEAEIATQKQLRDSASAAGSTQNMAALGLLVAGSGLVGVGILTAPLGVGVAGFVAGVPTLAAAATLAVKAGSSKLAAARAALLIAELEHEVAFRRSRQGLNISRGVATLPGSASTISTIPGSSGAGIAR
jgi:hypothetical protein